MVIGSLWPRRRATSSGFLLFLAVFLSFLVNVVALLGLFIVSFVWYRDLFSLKITLRSSSEESVSALFNRLWHCFFRQALRKSLRLERVRKSVQANFQGNWTDVYRKYAVNDPSHGMQFGMVLIQWNYLNSFSNSVLFILLLIVEEFNRLASDYSQGRLHFDLADLHIIFNALDEHQ